MLNKNKDKLIIFLIGFCIGIFLAVAGGGVLKKAAKFLKVPKHLTAIRNKFPSISLGSRGEVREDFTKSTLAVNGKSFGKNNQLTFELFRNGTFVIDGESGHAWQKSKSYRDSAFIRSTNPLSKTYKIMVKL